VKNQYFGDVNDYRKYGLLRALQSNGEGRLLVAWMLTPDDGGHDGGKRSYLDQADEWRLHDPELFEGLSASLASAAAAVSLIEGTTLLPRASYHSRIVPEGRDEREIWFRELLAEAQRADLVFLDPDNGIEVKSVPIGRPKSSKYVSWSEITELWNVGCSLLIYQHLPRKPRDVYAQELARELESRTGASLVRVFWTPHVLFLLAAQERHRQQVQEAIDLLAERWPGNQIRVMRVRSTCTSGSLDSRAASR
jgi:hypothetical protein